MYFCLYKTLDYGTTPIMIGCLSNEQQWKVCFQSNPLCILTQLKINSEIVKLKKQEHIII